MNEEQEAATLIKFYSRLSLTQNVQEVFEECLSDCEAAEKPFVEKLLVPEVVSLFEGFSEEGENHQ